MAAQTLRVVGTDFPGPVRALLRDRERTFTLQDAVPDDMADLRGLILGPGIDAAEARSLVQAAIAAEVPVLWYGPAAATQLQDRATPLHAPTLIQVVMTTAGEDDPVTAATMPGAQFTVSASPVTSLPSEFEPLWVDKDGGVLLARQASAYVTACDLDVPELGEGTDKLRPFVLAQVAALVGRWVDLAVGRTEEEKPWGRRGPTPTPAPGLSLHPA